MIRAYDYFGHIDLGAEEDDEAAPYENCPLCVNTVSPADSEFIYQSLCLRCARIIHVMYAHPYHPVCQSAYIPTDDDSTQALGLIKMRLYNMIESFISEECRESVEIIKDLLDRTPADHKLLPLINASLIPLLVTKKFNRHRITYMIHTAGANGYINLEESQSLHRRLDDLILHRGV